jgi:hypothetical protein
MSYVGMFRASATDPTLTSRYDGDIPGWGGLAQHDKLIVGDFDGDGKADLFIFNGDDWGMSYLGMFRSTGTALQMVQRYDGDVPGWGGLAQHDKFLLPASAATAELISLPGTTIGLRNISGG